jgi:DMSO/TMAO reductase YedYZ molybdopterin-dependent catalytic subunit
MLKEFTAEVKRGVALTATTTGQVENAAQAMYKAMNDNQHSWTLNSGFTREEVDYAFHNHGSHHELLDMDITDIASHYVLLHFDAQNIPEETYKLEIKGLINKPITLTLSDIKKFPKKTTQIVMECAGSDRGSTFPSFNHHSPWGLQPIGQAE